MKLDPSMRDRLGLLLLLFSFCTRIHLICSQTDPKDAAALLAVRNDWQNTPPNWKKSNDPCRVPWEGVSCTDSRVTELKLSNVGITGTLNTDIWSLTELTSLDLSSNKNLSGSIPRRIVKLSKLHMLILADCSFSGSIPNELGNLTELTFLALNSNKFSGSIPASLGMLSNLTWLDLTDNQFSGPVPVSDATSPGLDLLLRAEHFHLSLNQLSGPIPETLFHPDMTSLIHVLFDGNQLNGSIPSSLGLLPSLEALRLDRNQLTGEVPTNLSNLVHVSELNLANNYLTGPIPNLSNLESLSNVDLSNNSFDSLEAPAWFSTLTSLTTLVMENVSLQGTVPTKLFSLPWLEQVRMKNNRFNGTLDLGQNVSPELELVDFADNNISAFTIGSEYSKALILENNTVCAKADFVNSLYCNQDGNENSYSFSEGNCGSNPCTANQMPDPQSCACVFPLQGNIFFRAPSFGDLSNKTLFQELEASLSKKLDVQVSIIRAFFDSNDYLVISLACFPSEGKYMSMFKVSDITHTLHSQAFKPPSLFGPYIYQANPYEFPDEGGTAISTSVVAGIAVCGTILVLGLIGLAIYAIRQKHRAQKAIQLSKPFASWASGGEDVGGAPQLKGARFFSFEELRKCTKNFSSSNEIGSGGYGKVYRGMLPDGQLVAIKRAQQGSMQGALEFKTEIELLSRVHHRNLVGLVGFCCEQGEQMLIYEFMPNGSLYESLAGKSGIHLDWKRRLGIALGSARGLSYLHDHANPPIIHRDIKSTNILLDEYLTAKVSDFGLSKLVSDGGGHVTTQVKGTLGYLDPEYYMTQQLTEKSDVYSFGVVMLELIIAKPPIEKGKYIVREIRTRLNKQDEVYCGLQDIIDPTIRNNGKLEGFGKFLDLAMQCVEESGTNRPTMSEVVKAIENILQNDGISVNSASTPSSTTDFGVTKGSRHPYIDNFPERDLTSSGAFDYSGRYMHSVKIEPK